MPVLDLDKKHKRFYIEQEDSVAFGNQSIENNTPSVPSDTSCELTSQFQKYPRKYPNRITAAINQGEHDISLYRFIDNQSYTLFKNIGPLTQSDLLDSEEDQVLDLISRIRESKTIPYRNSLANRLLTLFHDAKEEDPASLGIAAGSLRNFYKFLLLHTNLKCPTISLAPDYNIYASWRGEQRRIFSVHFLPNGDARFVIFMPNVKHPERQIRISGAVTADILMETVAPYQVCDWIS